MLHWCRIGVKGAAVRLLYVGPVGKDSGYGQAATLNAAALESAGVDFDILLTDPSAKPSGPYARLGARIVRELSAGRGYTHVVVHAVPSELGRIGAELPSRMKRLAFTTWESCPFPVEMANEIGKYYDSVLVPSTWNESLLVEAGLNAQTVPHAFDPQSWWRRAPVAASPPGRGGRPAATFPRDSSYNGATPRYTFDDATRGAYTFLSVLTWNARKNPIGLLTAFFHAFSAADNVELVIVTPSWIAEEVQNLANGMRLSSYPHVRLRGLIGADGRLSESDYRQLHWDADCYVTASRGEGFGLGAFEARICGKPVIAPIYGGFTDFLDGWAAPVHYQTTPVLYPESLGSHIEVKGVKVRAITRNAHEGARGDQMWIEPDLVEMADLMKQAAAGKLVAPHGDADPKSSLESFTVPTVGWRFREVLEAA